MNNNKFRKADRLFAALLSIGYLLAGLVWFGLSDEAGKLLFADPDALARYQTGMAFGFLLASALVVYVLAARGSRLADPFRHGQAGAGLSALLVGLVLVTAAPLVVLLGYNVLAQTRHKVQDANSLVQGAAGSTSAGAQAFLRERAQLARMLARRPRIQAVDRQHCDPLLAEIAAMHDGLLNVAVLDRAGDLVCAARAGPHVRVAGRDLRTTAPLLKPSGQLLALTYPVRGKSDELVGSVQLLLATSALDHLVEDGAPSGVTRSLLTSAGEVLAHAPPAPGHLGRQVAEMARHVEGLQHGNESVVARGLDGKERFYAVRRVPGTELVAVAGVEVGQAFGPLRIDALRSFGVAVAALLLASLLITAIVRRIATPMKGLARAAESVSTGQFDQRAPETGPREVAGVAAQFNRMLDRLPVLERELRDSEARHRTLLEKLSHNIPGVIFQLRREPGGHAAFPFCSERVERMFEVTQSQAAADACAMLARIHPDDRQDVDAALAVSAETLGDFVREYRVLLPVGGLRHYLTYAQPELLAAGDVLWHGCTVDVTPLQVAQQALQLANEHLEARVARRTRALAAANESLESFSYSVAHDLRAPLHAIEGFARALPELIARSEPARVERLVQRIAANTAQMGRMIDGLLEVARAGNGRLDERELQFGDMVSNVLTELQLPAAAQVEVAPLPLVRGDPATLRQVWWNLLANAVKFTSHRPQPRIAIGFEREPDELVFWVRDNGAGFDPEYAGRLFAAFQRLHDANEFEGTGIGLALAKRVVERHGGRMWAEGQPDAGATFYFSLPVGRWLA
ncbi:MAG TPA: ATP-binding protein [Ramlibacter sp.]|nr:ATP-binding protein [Ramlibacter sp.]